MTKGTRIGLWTCIALLCLGQLLSTVLLYGEVADLRLQVEVATGARPAVHRAEPAHLWHAPALPTIAAPHTGAVETWGGTLRARALGAYQPLSTTTVITLAVRGSGAADPLLDLPILVCGDSAAPVDGPSLEQARQDLLALITQGAATITLQFIGTPDLTRPCTLQLNPQHTASDVLAPRLDIPVPQQIEENSSAKR